MVKQRLSKRSQEEIFAAYGWWDKNCALNLINRERCDYIESCVTRTWGGNALSQQQVLEIGCGGGLICAELARRGAVAMGVDPSREALVIALTRSRQEGLGAQSYFIPGCAETLPFADGSFSVIVCLDVLEHVQDLRATIREITRVLAPGGLFIFDTINRTWIARLALIWIGERFFQHQGLVPGLHNYHAFIKPRELQELLRENALDVREIAGFMPRLVGTHVRLGPGWFTGVSYVGYAVKRT
ncbi:MAG TPA: bifunctional 2-polyprenyl-6-hydroxyphenol methylase/3-demethylubiquinol 3-O-methyltransferase UbiG [Ktedonobacteraceae bacterium]